MRKFKCEGCDRFCVCDVKDIDLPNTLQRCPVGKVSDSLCDWRAVKEKPHTTDEMRKWVCDWCVNDSCITHSLIRPSVCMYDHEDELCNWLAVEQKTEPVIPSTGYCTWTSVPLDGSVAYVHVVCPGCEEADEKIKRLKYELHASRDAHDLTLELANERREEIERLKVQLDHSTDEIDRADTAAREAMITLQNMRDLVGYKQAEIEQLREQIPHVGARIALKEKDETIARLREERDEALRQYREEMDRAR